MSATCLPNYLPAATMVNSTFMAPITTVTIPIYNSTSPTYALWNPAGSNRLLMPISIELGVEATGSAVIGSLGLSQVINTTSAFATGLPIAAWTDTTVYNGLVGRTGNNQGRVASSATLTTAGNLFYHFGFSAATTSLVGGWISITHDFNGKIVMEPGTLVHLVSTPAAQTDVMTACISWIECDTNGNILAGHP
jgi:hypothetical protein